MDYESTSEIKYYIGRIKRPDGWNKLQTKVKTKLNSTTIIVFLIWFYDYLVEYCNEENHRIPGLI